MRIDASNMVVNSLKANIYTQVNVQILTLFCPFTCILIFLLCTIVLKIENSV